MMRKFFCKNDADDFEDLPAFNEDKVSLTMMIAGICAAVVAVAAILCDGLMAVKEGTALAGVAAVARIVGVPFLRHRFVAGLRAMRVMAGHAVHLSGEQRMCSRFKEIRFLFSVAGNAKRRGRPII